MRTQARQSQTTDIARGPRPANRAQSPAGAPLAALQRRIETSPRVARTALPRMAVQPPVVQRNGDDPPKQDKMPPKAVIQSPVLEMFRRDPQRSSALAQALFPQQMLRPNGPQNGPGPVPFPQPFVLPMQGDPQAFAHRIRPFLPPPIRLIPYFSPVTLSLLYPSLMTAGVRPAGPQWQMPTAIKTLLWVGKNIGEGIEKFASDLRDGVEVTHSAMGYDGPEKQAHIKGEGRRFASLLRRAASNPSAVVDQTAAIFGAAYAEYSKHEEIKDAVHTAAQENVLKRIGGASAVYVGAKMPIKYGITKPHVMPRVMRKLAEGAFVFTPDGYKRRVLRALRGRITRFAVGRVVGGLVSAPVTAGLGALAFAGTLHKAMAASEQLKREDPQLYERLRAHDLDLLIFLVDDVRTALPQKSRSLMLDHTPPKPTKKEQ